MFLLSLCHPHIVTPLTLNHFHHLNFYVHSKLIDQIMHLLLTHAFFLTALMIYQTLAAFLIQNIFVNMSLNPLISVYLHTSWRVQVIHHTHYSAHHIFQIYYFFQDPNGKWCPLLFFT